MTKNVDTIGELFDAIDATAERQHQLVARLAHELGYELVDLDEEEEDLAAEKLLRAIFGKDYRQRAAGA